MSTADNNHHQAAEFAGDLAEVTGGGLRAAEVAVLVIAGFLVWPPLLILAVVVALPSILSAAVLGASVAAIAGWGLLVRRVRAYHRKHRTTLFLHRLQRR